MIGDRSTGLTEKMVGKYGFEHWAKANHVINLKKGTDPLLQAEQNSFLESFNMGFVITNQDATILLSIYPIVFFH